MESEQPQPAAPATSASTPQPRPRVWPIAAAVIVGGIGALMLFVSTTRSTTVSATPAVSPAAAMKTGTTSTPVHVTPTTAKQSWRATRPRQDVRYGRDVIIFELAAEHDVPVWHKRVRPQLAIRCAEKVMDLYVMTNSAASFEGSTNQHTVHLAFDGNAATTEKWDHSVDHEALFAPDSDSLVHQIAAAKTMTFAFTPFNTAPVFVHFNVTGLETHLAKAAKTCGLKRR